MEPPLPDELVDEVLLRLPPADPASLVRAALVCRGWRRLLSFPAFRRRYLEFHGSPPMPGFLYRRALGAHFMSTPSFRPPFAAGRGRPASWRALDARHGRVLYYDGESVPLDPVIVKDCKLHIWSREPAGPNGWGWATFALEAASTADGPRADASSA